MCGRGYFRGDKKMRVVILGCGKLGSRLAEQLWEMGHRVVILDRDRDAFKKMSANFKGECLLGDGFNEDIMRQAFEEKADVFVAATDKDNINIMMAQWVKNRFKVPRLITRVYDPTVAGAYREEIGLETICPTTLALDLILTTLRD
jgi:trk system potassium uptake protein TrkA